MTTTYDPAYCSVQKSDGTQCNNKQGATVEGRRTCVFHANRHDQGHTLIFVPKPPRQEQLIVMHDPNDRIPQGPSTAHKLAAKHGLLTVKEAITKGGKITEAYLNKEEPEMPEYVTGPIDVHGDHGQPNPDYEAEVYRLQMEEQDDEVQTLYEESLDKALIAYQERKPLYVIAFTGHRPPKLGGYGKVNPTRAWVKKQMLAKVESAIAKFGETHEIVIVWGAALGVDQWSAALANYKGLRHVVFVPFKDFDTGAGWPSSSVHHLREKLMPTTDESLLNQLINERGLKPYAHSGGVAVISEPGYTSAKMMVRNKAMVDVADAVVAVWDGSSGGTANAVGYARHEHKDIVRINPADRS